MYVRLAFAVAAHLEPEILIVDEVLAVGDASFQKKCLGKMGEAAKRGRTVLFVSHNMQAVMSLCTRAMLFEGGKLIDSGDPHSITEKYVKTAEGGSGMRLERTWETARQAPGNDHIRMHRVGIVPEKIDKELGIDMETAFRLEIEYWNLVAGSRIIVNLAFYSLDDSPAFETFSYSDKNWGEVAMPDGLYRSICKIPANLLNQGDYRIRVVFLDPNARTLFDLRDGAFLTIHNQSEPKMRWFGRFIGHLHPQLPWSTEMICGRDASNSGNMGVQFEKELLGG
jgi:lipopolysaccharide transport system ATP-binding protein